MFPNINNVDFIVCSLFYKISMLDHVGYLGTNELYLNSPSSSKTIWKGDKQGIEMELECSDFIISMISNMIFYEL